jgi:hypothetical protein
MKFRHLLDPDPPRPTDESRHAVVRRAGRLRRQRTFARGVSATACSLAVVLTLALLLQPSPSPSRLFKLGPPYRISITLSAKTFPSSIYPDASVYPPPLLAGASGDWSGCPALAGVVGTVRPQPQLVARLLDQLGRDKLSALKASDPSYWPIILEGNWVRFQDVSPGRLLITSAAQSGYASLLGRCSPATVRDTWVAKTCPGPNSRPASETCSRDPALAGQVFLIDRLGHWLVDFTYPLP